MTLISRTVPQSRGELIAKRDALPRTSPKRQDLNRKIAILTIASLSEDVIFGVMKKEAGNGV